MLIMQGALDDNVLPAIQEKFAATGGVCELTVFEGSEHGGAPSRDRRPTARANWSRRSSRLSCPSAERL
jgi:hypothetical protein